MRENFSKMLMGTQLRIYNVHHVWTLERRYRGLGDLDACYFSDGKEGWPLAGYGHRPCNYSGHQAGPVPYRHDISTLKDVQFCYRKGEWGGGGVGGGLT